MNIFKKNVENSLFRRVEKRIIDLCKSIIIPQRKKEIRKNIFSSIAIFGTMSLFVFLMLQFNNPFAILFVILGTLFAASSIYYFLCFLIQFIAIKEFEKNLDQQSNINYSPKFYDINFKKDFNKLNGEEIKELLSSPLNPLQLQFLNNISIKGFRGYKGYITLQELKIIDSMSLEQNKKEHYEEKNKQIDKMKEKIDEFFSTYQINKNINYQFLFDNIDNSIILEKEPIEKENTLASKL